MAKTYLSEKVWHDPEGTNYIMLDVTDKITQQGALDIDGVELTPKDEYHITLVPVSKIVKEPSEQMHLIADVEQLLLESPRAISFVALSEDRYVCRKNEEMTVIVPATITGLEDLQEVVQKYSPDYQSAFPHVTLLKSDNSQYGIGVGGVDDFNTRCTKLQEG